MILPPQPRLMKKGVPWRNLPRDVQDPSALGTIQGVASTLQPGSFYNTGMSQSVDYLLNQTERRKGVSI